MFDEKEEPKPKAGLAILLAKKVADKKPKEEEAEEEGFEADSAMVDDMFSAVKEGDKDLFKSALDAYIESKLSERE